MLTADGNSEDRMVFRRAMTPYRDASGGAAPGSIATLEPVELGGVTQWILIQGRSASLPILLFLHGGPGDPNILWARRFQAPLEESFLVVNWDQRGCGLSYSRDASPDSMTIDQLVGDALELARKLCDRFRQKQLFLIGHSWGTLLAFRAIEKDPRWFEQYFAVSPFVSDAKAAEIAYWWALVKARSTLNDKAIRELETVGPPSAGLPRSFAVRRKWVEKFGGYSRHWPISRILRSALTDLQEYTLRDLLRYGRGQAFSVGHLLPQAAQFDLSEESVSLAVPLVLCQGRFDYVTPAELSRTFFDHLKAPEKTWVWFEDAAHLVPFDQPEVFGNTVRQLALGGGDFPS